MVNVQLPKVLFRDFNSTYNVHLHNMQFCQCGICHCITVIAKGEK